MSFIGNMLNAGNEDSKYSALTAPVSSAVTPNQLAGAHASAESGIKMQQDMVQQLALQNGIGKQGDVYGQQGQLAAQLQQQALGQGPNPAQAALAQQTAANTSNQAALMAGQRGAGQNAGMLARQAAMQGGANQQQAVGQGATMQAQQQIAAQQALAQQQQAMGNTAGNLANEYTGAQTQFGNLTQNNLGTMTGAIANMNNANVSNANQMNSQNGAMARQNSAFNQAQSSGAMSQMGKMMMPMGAEGGQVIGSPDLSSSVIPITQPAAPKEDKGSSNPMSSMMGMMGGGAEAGGAEAAGGAAAGGGGGIMSLLPLLALAAKGGQIQMGGGIQNAHDFSSGGHVPGQAKVQGNSYSNDNVPALLSPGEIVIPRSVMQDKNPSEGAAKFVAAILAKNGRVRK